MKLIILLPIILAGTMNFKNARAADNVHFSGALVSEPCTLPDSESDIKLDFSSVIEKSLYQNQRTKSQQFEIHLKDCDPALMDTVSVTFEGSADAELTTMLALDPSSSAKGVAIGLELVDGTPLAINQTGTYQPLNYGDNSLIFNAYIQAKPSAISQKEIVAGDFSAISTFILEYQ